MTLNGVMTKRLLVVSPSTHSDHVNDRSAMIMLVNAAKEAREGNLMISLTHLSRGLKECADNDELFLSKLMELDFQDLEMLYVALFGAEQSRKGSKKGSFKSKTSVGGSSFANEGFEMEYLSSENSCLEMKKRNSITKEEHEICLMYLHRAYSLQKQLQMSDCTEEMFSKVLEAHLKVENYEQCASLLSANKDKYADKVVSILTTQQKLGIFDACMQKVSQIVKEDIVPNKTDANYGIPFCLLASKLLPSDAKPHETMCRIYKQRKETARAIEIAANFLENIDSKNESMLLMLLLCEVDKGTPHKVLSRFDQMEKVGLVMAKNLIATRGMLLILCDYAEVGMKILMDLKIGEEYETVRSVVKLMNDNVLLEIITKTKAYIEGNFDKKKNSKSETIQAQINEEKNFLKLVSQTLSKRNPRDLSFAKLYTDCLLLCDECGMIESYLATQIRQHEGEMLPVVYLANARLKMGAYNAAREDFRALLHIAGEEKLRQSLSLLPASERMEIARVHRLHGFRYLEKEFAFREGVECFSVAICAAGKSALGLVLTRGYCYMHLNNYELASNDFNYCVRSNETSAPVLCARAVLYAVTTHVEESIVDFRKAFTSDINACFQSVIKLPLDHVLIFSQLIVQYVKQEIERVKNRKASQQDKLNEKNLDPRRRTLDNVFNTEVLKYSEFLCNLFPEDIEYWLTRVACLYFASGNSTALSEVNRALDKYPNEERLIIWKGVLLISQHKFDDAINQFRELTRMEYITDILSFIDLQLRKRFLDLLLQQAKSLAELEGYEESLKLYNFAIVFSNKDVSSFRGRMDCYLKMGDQKKWLNDLNETMKREPTSEDACMRAQYYLSNGMDLNACEDFITALKLNERNTIDIVTKNVSIDTVTKLFHNIVVQLLEMRIAADVNRYCEAGLKFNPHDKRLKRLKERTCLDSHKCNLQ